MSSMLYSENTKKRSATGGWAKAFILLIISLGLLWFTSDVPVFLLFEPESMGWKLWLSYANDLILPFAFYFFICLGERWLRTWQVRALLAFAIPLLLELRQALYHPIGSYIGAFDPLDIVMYAISVGLAVIVERQVFARTLKFW